MEILLIGRYWELSWVIPSLMSRAGFTVDVIHSSPIMKYSIFVRECSLVPPHQSLIPQIKKSISKKYSWILITDDDSLKEILESDLSVEDKLLLFPVAKEENFKNLFSKIALSKSFSTHSIPTPNFVVAQNKDEAILYSQQLKFPLLLKVDYSSGGLGVLRCRGCEDIAKAPDYFFEKPILLQEELCGEVLDLSAFYWQGKLVFFSCSKFEAVIRPFGPSSLRTYLAENDLYREIPIELSQIGKTLGVSGFTNITCIQQSDGKRFYFEADMRPNIWVEMSRFYAKDPADLIANWFDTKKRAQSSWPVSLQPSKNLCIPHFLRLNFYKLLCNRHKVWQFIARDDYKILLRILLNRIFPAKIMNLIPKRHRNVIRQLKHRLMFMEARLFVKDSLLRKMRN